MLGFFKIFTLFHFNYIFIECLLTSLPSLSVRKLDKKMIERKRQDTLDMCRLFEAENQKQNLLTEDNIQTNEYDKIRKSEIKEKILRRSKRDIGTMYAVNPALNVEDEQRVETIIDKIYDDLLEKGQKIAYRRNKVLKTDLRSNEFAVNKTQNSGRRFPFAPVIMEGPTSTKAPLTNSDETGKTPRFKHGIIPYFIDSKTYDTHLSDTIMKAFDYIEKATCVRLQRLRERPTDLQSLKNVIWLYITNPSGIRQCVHSNDRAEIKGVQMIVFGYDCMALGDITHEVMHVLGFSHEHVRPDRDQYINILWDNIKPGYRKFFEIHDNPMVDNLPYDYASVLHYPPRAFSRNGQVTILTEPGIKVGQREGFSEMDVEKISSLYSMECVKRNREYLLKTCPSVVKSEPKSNSVTQQEIEDYFEDRMWSYGVVNYRLRDRMEFTAEEIENINAVIRHIEKETCIEFRDLTASTPQKHKDDDSSHIDSDYGSVEKYVQFDVGENDTKELLPNLMTSDKEENFLRLNEIKSSDNEFADMGRKDTKAGKQPGSRIKKANPPSPQRRHANSILVLTRYPHPGCLCPHPGKPDKLYDVKINTDCFNSVNDLLHLFVHVLGLDHQHNMHDRDSYLHIVWDELTEDVKTEMRKKLPPAASVGFPYDYQSVMHYPWLQVRNGRTNIMYPIWNDGWAMGHWQGLSSTDVQKLNLLYFKECIQRKQQAEEAQAMSKKP